MRISDWSSDVFSSDLRYRKRGCGMSTVQTWVADFAARGQGLTGANIPWLAAMRKRAIERFASEGWPTTKQENWRHTSLATLEQQSFLPAGQASVADRSEEHTSELQSLMRIS